MKYILILTILLIIPMIYAGECKNGVYPCNSNVQFNNPTVTKTANVNYSLVNVNNSQYLNGYNSSYFYPYSNPFGFYNSSTLPASSVNLSSYWNDTNTVDKNVSFYSINGIIMNVINTATTTILQMWLGIPDGTEVNTTEIDFSSFTNSTFNKVCSNITNLCYTVDELNTTSGSMDYTNLSLTNQSNNFNKNNLTNITYLSYKIFCNQNNTNCFNETNFENLFNRNCVYPQFNYGIKLDGSYYCRQVDYADLTGSPPPSTTANYLTDGMYNSADGTNRYLYDSNNFLSADWNSRQLKDTNGYNTIDWSQWLLNDMVGVNSIDWNSRRLFDTGESPVLSIDWSNRILYDRNSIISINYDAYSGRTLTDGSNILSMSWQDRQLEGTTGEVSLNYGSRQFLNSSGSVLLDYSGNKITGDGSGLTGISGGNSSWNESRANTLYDSISNPSKYWNYTNTTTSPTFNIINFTGDIFAHDKGFIFNTTTNNLNISRNITASYFISGAKAGITRVFNMTNSSGRTCWMNFTGGILTSSTC